MKKIKKIFYSAIVSVSLLTSTSASAIELDDVGGIVDGIGGILDSLGFSSNLADVPLQCYRFDDLLKISNLCSLVDFQASVSEGICASAPDLPFIDKVSSAATAGYSTDKLVDYCRSVAGDVDKEVKSVVSSSNVWATENDSLGEIIDFPSGDTKETFYKGDNPVLDFEQLIEKNRESLVSTYFNSKEQFHQQTAKYLINLAKIKKVGDVTEITTEDIGVAETMVEYEDEVNALAASVSSDMVASSPSNISSSMSSKITSYVDVAGETEAFRVAATEEQNINKLIDANASIKKGMLKELMSSEDDLAIPTQQTLNLYKESIRPKYAMLIRKQQAREAYITSLVDTESTIKKNIVSLTTKKSVIMKRNFDVDAATANIDALIR